MNRISVKILSLLLCLPLLCAGLPLCAANAEPAPKNPYRVGDTVSFGAYPQTQVEDEALVKALNAASAEWTAYPYYAGGGAPGSMAQEKYMSFTDVAVGGVKYRGVKITKYRPALTYGTHPAAEEAAQAENGCELRKTYWFRYDPVEWIVLDPAAGLLISKYILDAQAFSDTAYEIEDEPAEDDDDWYFWPETQTYSDAEGLHYANRYDTASLRAWLNGTFYAAAFSAEQRARILPQTLVTPAGEETVETRDSVFLLAAADTENEALITENDWGGTQNLLEDAYSTAYARAQGLAWSWYSCVWYLRTPGYGSAYAQSFGWSLSETEAARLGGVRPAICVDFNECAAGDADGDGKVTVEDARGVLRVAVGLALIPPYAGRYAEADADGKVTTADARLVLRCAVGLETQDAFSHFLKETAPAAADGIALNAKHRMGEISLSEGKSAALADRVVARACDGLTWTSSNPAAVKVSQNGTVTGLKKGFSCVYLTVGGHRYYFFVRVRSVFQEQIYALQNKYPDGYYWNAHTKSTLYPAVSEIPCSDHESGTYAYCTGQCAGFALLLSNEVFGTAAPIRYGVKKDDIKIGDYVRCLPHHSVFVIDRVSAGEILDYSMFSDENIVADSDVITVAECNWDCRCGISWGRQIWLDELEIDEGYSFTRY